MAHTLHHELGVGRQQIRAAVSNAAELRALHAALIQGSSPGNPRIPSMASPSPVPRSLSQLTAQDYPVFTPSYGGEAFPTLRGTQALQESWRQYGFGGGDAIESDERSLFSRKELEPHACPAEDRRPPEESSDVCASKRRNSLGDFRSASSCNKCRPAIISSEAEAARNGGKCSSNVVVPLTDSHSSALAPPRSKATMLSWILPRLKKKHKNEKSPYRSEAATDDDSLVLKDLGFISIEALKKQLLEANATRDAALREVAGVKSCLGDLKQRLDYLESYCEDLKRALKQAKQGREGEREGEGDPVGLENLGSVQRMEKSIAGKAQAAMPVSEEVMVEGFLQIVSEASWSVRHFCRTLVAQIGETDGSLLESLNALLRPFKQSVSSKPPSKASLYHLEAIVNQALYQDFENRVFQKNGSPKFLDPEQDRRAKFSSFVTLRNLSWNEVLRKGTKYYSEEFSKFCDLKMSCIISSVSWTRAWPEQLLQSFFIAAKCIWLLHLLAFSFDPPVGILRVEENSGFEPHYMEDVAVGDGGGSRAQGPNRVRVMVVPGFYVQTRVLRCKVLCTYKKPGA